MSKNKLRKLQRMFAHWRKTDNLPMVEIYEDMGEVLIYKALGRKPDAWSELQQRFADELNLDDRLLTFIRLEDLNRAEETLNDLGHAMIEYINVRPVRPAYRRNYRLWGHTQKELVKRLLDSE